MSKVYEAMQHVYAERKHVAPVKKKLAIEVVPSNGTDTQDLPLRRMEKEMRRLHQRIMALLPHTANPIIQCIGARQGEGTSTVVWEYGCLMAEKMNKSVLIVDGDTHTMPHHQALEIQPTISLQELLREEQSLNGSIPKVKGLSLYLCSVESDNHLQPQINAFQNPRDNWANIRTQFDYIVIDSPALSLSDAALTFCSIVDGVILVVEAESTRAPIVHHLRERIIQHGGHILGVVFNKQRHYIPEWFYKRL